MKTYVIKQIMGPTIQGEGSLTGKVTCFVRFAGCNMWDGRPETREASKCPYCDTDFFGGKRMTADEIVDELGVLMPLCTGWVTFSGGEPLLQLDAALCEAVQSQGFRVAVETNGTIPLPEGVDPDCLIMSPKVPIDQIKLDEFVDDLKVLFPHPNPAITPESFKDFAAGYYYVQPVNGDMTINLDHVQAAVEEAIRLQRMTKRTWGVSVQLHKFIGVP